MIRTLLVTLFVLYSSLIPVAQADRIKDLTDIAGIRDNQLIGYGLVVGLNGTGDGKNVNFTTQSVKSMLARYGVNVKIYQMGKFEVDKNNYQIPKKLDLKNVAAVMVTANIPAFSKPGQRIDVTVGSIGEATSLRGGSLLLSRLRGADGEVYAMAQGSLAVGGLGVSAAGSKITVNVPTVGRIPAGATVEREVASPFQDSGYMVMNLKQQDFTTTSRIVNAINENFGVDTAEALDSVSLRILAPDNSSERVSFMAMVQSLEVTPGEPPARVVVNSRSGTVVISRNVRVTASAVTHGSLTLKIKMNNQVSQAESLAPGGETVQVQNADVEIIEGKNPRMFLLKPGVELRELVDAVNTIGASPSALVSILETLKRAGSLRADLIVI
ncbi:MAG: flagellar basal body P-ring protein FlgI [Methylococcales bacterium]|jgi:flagellar P-ring protein precursor FlgI|nr:flagellar basal body P-ring protein FlgI [Methylococcales bacterium]MBT3816383.1 flagellar basal body P-ring protein FlgI [Methylococcales bacterium]MBT4348204.1 flagellar basal body P-ring protein FlgI [Methylococcales bacterium]MBT7107443.1 flagellar basal body P-ring protein FlgI [Methylococcales bacterium]MBT7576809.1 flagellar basal body P-ring protein FlgI [Methylococcales bacterium]